MKAPAGTSDHVSEGHRQVGPTGCCLSLVLLKHHRVEDVTALILAVVAFAEAEDVLVLL